MSDDSTQEEYRFSRFGLLVTARGEADFLPGLFRSFMASTGCCTFEVIRRVRQLSPITSQKRRLEMVGTGKIIPDKDAEEIGLSARRWLQQTKNGFVLLIDDLEGDRVSQRAEVYGRYRTIFDTMLGPLKNRAAVHFLVNMLEAYYFADAKAVNEVLGTQLTDHVGDVETMDHPKNHLKRLFRGFDEIEHGRRIVERLDVERILSDPQTCASLRTLYAWCCKVLGLDPSERYRLADGILDPITRVQLEAPR